MIDVERVDFIRVPVTDSERGGALLRGDARVCERNPNSTDDLVEFEAGKRHARPRRAARGQDYEFAPLPFGSIALRVPDVEAARAKLEEAGLEVVGETWDSGVCNGAGFTDPDGNRLLLHHRYAPYPDGTTP